MVKVNTAYFLFIIILLTACNGSDKKSRQVNAVKYVGSDSFYLTGFYYTVDTTNGLNIRNIETDLPGPDSTRFYLDPKPFITAKDFKAIEVGEGDLGPALIIELDAEGKKIFAEVTGKSINKYIAFIVNNKLITVAFVMTKIEDGEISVPIKGYSKTKLAALKEIIESGN